jgi:hypothetical protein
VVLHG